MVFITERRMMQDVAIYNAQYINNNHAHVKYLANYTRITFGITKLQEQQQVVGSMHDGANVPSIQ